MKKVVFFILALCMFGCSDDANIAFNDSIADVNHKVSNEHEIDAAKALEYAGIYFNQAKTRSSAPLKMDYIVNEKLTRSGDMTDDTVAYIINRGENDGFVIISSDDRVYPILAHSDNGTFIHEEGSIVDVQFTSLIDDYLKENENSPSQVLDEECYASCYYLEAVVDSFGLWNQRDPFNYYVIEEHPGCPVGCVPLATGIIMLHCKPKITYNNLTFNAKKIIRSLEKHSNPYYRPPMLGPSGTSLIDTTTYSYNVATDSIALMLHWIGKDLGTTYTPLESSTNVMTPIYFMDTLGYSLKYPRKLVTYSRSNALSDMKDGYMLYMQGRNNGSTTSGHVWVADGYDICVDYETGDTVRACIHCNWGWGGSNNGYYSREVFDVVLSSGPVTFNMVRYNAIKMEK